MYVVLCQCLAIAAFYCAGRVRVNSHHNDGEQPAIKGRPTHMNRVQTQCGHMIYVHGVN